MMTRSLFGEADLPAGDSLVSIMPSFESWQREARRLLKAQMAPERVHWAADLELPVGIARPPSPEPTDPSIRVPREFLSLARAAACHSEPDRFALLYRVLWRLAGETPWLLQVATDPDVLRLTAWAKSVTRDAHKMKAFVRFRAVPATEGEPRYVAWFEPEHSIVDFTAPFFQRRFSTMRWSILTPRRCAHWEGDGGQVDGRTVDGGTVDGRPVDKAWFSPGVTRDAAPTGDIVEQAWLRYYQSIFNPARVKPEAMRAEMPMKYWKNLPEAQLIHQLLDEAPRRVAQMRATRRDVDVPKLAPLPRTPEEADAAAFAATAPASLDRLALEARGCRRCPLWEPATQTVFGEGPADARVILVGEQPGDREDLAGSPFVGPAGSLLRRALPEAGLDANRLYLTNTVKHFRFRVSGKRRIHAKPREGEIDACRTWLEAEIEHVSPALIVCLGATAAGALLGKGIRVGEVRGKVIERGGTRYLVTVHPSYLLRLPDPAVAAAEYQRFVADLAIAAAWSD